MIKFDRNYVLQIQTNNNGGLLTITLPFTIEFDITRNTLTSANVCQIRIYNLAQINRDQIRHNAYDYGNYKRILFKAGYGQNLATVFKGNITAAWSVREGTDFITQIECYDGGFAFVNGIVNLQVPAGTPRKTAIAAVAKSGLPNVSVGAIGNYEGVSTRGNSYSGNTMDVLQELTGGGAFIDNEKFNALETNEYIASLAGVGIISSQSGLLGTPILEQNVVRFDMLFEPGLNAGHKVLLDSSTNAGFNGDHKITSVKHRGMISAAVCGNAITTGEFFFSKIPKGVASI